MLSVNQNRSTYSFLILKTFIAFSYFMAPARTSIQLNGERGQTCFILILGGTPFFTIEYDILPFLNALYQTAEVPFYFYSAKSF